MSANVQMVSNAQFFVFFCTTCIHLCYFDVILYSAHKFQWNFLCQLFWKFWKKTNIRAFHIIFTSGATCCQNDRIVLMIFMDVCKLTVGFRAAHTLLLNGWTNRASFRPSAFGCKSVSSGLFRFVLQHLAHTLTQAPLERDGYGGRAENWEVCHLIGRQRRALYRTAVKGQIVKWGFRAYLGCSWMLLVRALFYHSFKAAFTAGCFIISLLKRHPFFQFILHRSS